MEKKHGLILRAIPYHETLNRTEVRSILGYSQQTPKQNLHFAKPKINLNISTKKKKITITITIIEIDLKDRSCAWVA